MEKMKKLMVALVLALLICTTVTGALAGYSGTMYVNKSKVYVYDGDVPGSNIIATYKGGRSVFVDDVSPDGRWAQILVEDTKNGGQMLGFIPYAHLSKNVPQDFCKHDWSKWTVKTQPTCTEKGKRTRTCSKCGKVSSESIKATGHDWSRWRVTKEATCAVKGERTRTCQTCGKVERESYLEEHTYGAWELIQAPTCTETGARKHTCVVCGATQAQQMDMLPHDYAYQITVAATDHSSGIRAKICKVCGHNGGEESFDPDGTLRRKDRSEAVYNMQQLLVEQGYLNAGGADGIFGGGTEKALMKYQQDRGLNPDGIGWPQTLKDLEHDFGPWTILKPMTRAESGERVRTCRGCGFEQHETLEGGTVLERGSRGESVRALQQIIKQVGYDAGGFDGIYGKKLDAAMAGFAADNGLNIEAGKVRPADVDALVNAWFKTIPADQWKGEGGADSPVNLALSVTPADKADESGITSYRWTMTNLGSEKVMFNALLLTFGDQPDYKNGSLVMVLDGSELKPAAANSISGFFSAASEWGEGDLNFAAMAVSDSTGDKWLSNTVTFENAENPSKRTIAPMENRLDVNQLPDGIYPVSFDRGDVLDGASGIFMNAVHIYTQDWYDLVDVNALKVDDTIIVEGEEVPVLTLTVDEYGYIVINEDEAARAFYLVTEEDSNGYTVRGMNDLATFTDQGMTSLVLDPSATFTDAWDIDSAPVVTAYEGIVEAMQATENDSFVPDNTTVRIEGGRVVEINRAYMP